MLATCHADVVATARSWSVTTSMVGDSTQRVTISAADGHRLTWREAIELWKSPDFAKFYSETLAASPWPQFFWECPPVNSEHAASLPFEHVTVRARAFAPANPSDFHEHFASCAAASIITFANLGGDAQLVAPCERGAPRSNYAHLAAFVRGAPEEQRIALWALVGERMEAALTERGKRPTWLSTEGSGVPWLHVRLDSRPKYFHHNVYLDFCRDG